MYDLPTCLPIPGLTAPVQVEATIQKSALCVLTRRQTRMQCLKCLMSRRQRALAAPLTVPHKGSGCCACARPRGRSVGLQPLWGILVPGRLLAAVSNDGARSSGNVSGHPSSEQIINSFSSSPSSLAHGRCARPLCVVRHPSGELLCAGTKGMPLFMQEVSLLFLFAFDQHWAMCVGLCVNHCTLSNVCSFSQLVLPVQSCLCCKVPLLLPLHFPHAPICTTSLAHAPLLLIPTPCSGYHP